MVHLGRGVGSFMLRVTHEAWEGDIVRCVCVTTSASKGWRPLLARNHRVVRKEV